MHLYRDGKYPEAATEYQRVIDSGLNPAAGYAGLARVYLRQNKVALAEQAATNALQKGPNLASSHVVMGEVLFRQGKIEEAGEEFRKLVLANTSDARAYYGLSRVLRASSYYNKAQILLDRAHELDAKDPEIERAWTRTQSLEDQIKNEEARLADANLSADAKKEIENRLTVMKALLESGKSCRLVAPVKSTETPFRPLMEDAYRSFGYGLPVNINGASSTLQFDTGASGMLISQAIADKAGIKKVADSTYYGIGDNGEQKGWIGRADRIQIGQLVFENCFVEVADRPMDSAADGLLGADVFSSFLVELKFPDQKLVLSQLPDDPAQSAVPASLTTTAPNSQHHHDRYIAPDMKNYTGVYRFGHELLVPTRINKEGPYLFLLDTGASVDNLDLDIARKFTKVDKPGTYEIKGVSGKVRDVYRAQEVHLTFGGFNQDLQAAFAFNLESLNEGSRPDIAGIMGFQTLRILNLKLDYRDGLVFFGFDEARSHHDNSHPYTGEN